MHGDDTPVPVLAKGMTATGRACVHARDDRPFGGRDPPAAVFYYSRDRTGDVNRRPTLTHRIASSTNVTLMAQSALTIRRSSQC